MNQETLYNIIVKYLQSKHPTLYLGEGGLCYDLLTPLCYMAMELYNRMDEVQQELNPVSASKEMLQVWAEPRIGKPQEATNTILYIYTTETTTRSWIYQDTYTFNYVTTIEENLYSVQSTYLGAISISVGDTLYEEEDSTKEATVRTILQRGQNEESVEVYRTRYLESFLVDSQAGMGAYYREQIQKHELVGITGINYKKCVGGNVQISVLNTSLTSMSDEGIQELLTYYTETNNIVPFGQTLEINTLTGYEFTIKVYCKGTALTVEIVRSYLEEKTKNTLIPNLMNSTSLRTSFTVADIRNDMISLFTEYGQIQSVLINSVETSSTEFLLDGQYPVWKEVKVVSVG